MSNRSKIFLDMRPEREFNIDPIDGAINVALADLVFNKLGVLEFIPRNTIIEYYHPFPKNIEVLVIEILNQNGFMNLNNLGNIVAPPIIYECKSTPAIQFME